MASESTHRSGFAATAALLMSVVAVVLAGWALYRSYTDAEPSYTDQQRADAQRAICEAMDIVRKGVSLNTNLVPAGGPSDVTGAQAVAANARVSLYDGGQYLLARLDPATPPELADAVREFANTLLDIGAHATAGATNDDPAQARRLDAADATNASITQMCR